MAGEEKNCSNCKFSAKSRVLLANGERREVEHGLICCLHPPVNCLVNRFDKLDLEWQFPPVHALDWCGQHQDKDVS